jgi:hypothetical protein
VDWIQTAEDRIQMPQKVGNFFYQMSHEHFRNEMIATYTRSVCSIMLQHALTRKLLTSLPTQKRNCVQLPGGNIHVLAQYLTVR